MKKYKVALVHDYINEFGGAERVLMSLSEIYPDAPIYTLFSNENSHAYKYFKNKKIIQSWFGYIPFSSRLISPLRFLVPLMWLSFDFSRYDIVITSSSWAVTKGMRNAKKEICYIHTPPRYLYGLRESRDWNNYAFTKLIKLYALVVNHFMRLYDFNQSQKPDLLIANSINVSKRISKFYKRNSQVIYPPINYKKFSDNSIKPEKGDYYLAGGRLVKHKNFDKIINAFINTEKKLLVFGTGSEETMLKKIAVDHPNIELLGRVSEKKQIALFKGARAFIVASRDEDLGMTQLEAQAAGTPIIAYKAEGYLETIIENNLPAQAGTGVFINSLKPEAFYKAILNIESKKWDKKEIKKFAYKFREDRFKKEIKREVENLLKQNA